MIHRFLTRDLTCALIGALLGAISGVSVALAAGTNVIHWETAVDGVWSLDTNWDQVNVPNGNGESGRLPSLGAPYIVTVDQPLSLDGIEVLGTQAGLDFSGAYTLLFLTTAGLENHGTVKVNHNTTLQGHLRNQVTGQVFIDPGRLLSIDTDVFNDGIIHINPSAASSDASIILQNDLNFDGTGFLELSTAGSPSDAQLGLNTGPVLTNGNDHRIRGEGIIGAPFDNFGKIHGDQAGRVLRLQGFVQNNFEEVAAIGGGIVEILSADFEQIAYGRLIADNGTILLTGNTKVTGGRLITLGTGVIKCAAGEETLRDVRLEGNFWVEPATTTRLEGDFFHNEGTLLINSQSSSSDARVQVDGDLALTGPGRIILSGNTSFTDAQFATLPGGSVDQGFNHTIEGSGQITARIANHGRIIANGPYPLRLAEEDIYNDGTIEAFSPSLLRIESPIEQEFGGKIIATGAVVEFGGGAEVSGGELRTDASGEIQITDATPAFRDVDISGNVQVNPASRLSIGGIIHNEGHLKINSGSASDAILHADTTTVLEGFGFIELRSAGKSNDAQIVTSADALLTNTIDHGIEGGGSIQANLFNEGQVHATDAFPLVLRGFPIVNTGDITAQSGSVLRLETEVTQSGNGNLTALGGILELGGGARILGGELGSDFDGEVRITDGTPSIQNTALFGLIQLLPGSFLTASGTIFNDSRLKVNEGASSDAFIHFDSTTTLSGGGSIELFSAGSDSDAQVKTKEGVVLTQSAGHSIEGAGEINALLVNDGQILANGAHRLLVRTKNITNNGLMSAVDGSVLRLDTTIEQGPSGVVEGLGAAIELAGNAHITGGRVATDLDGVIQVVFGAPSLSNLLLEGQVELQPGTQLALEGAIENNAWIEVNSGSSSDAIVRADTSLELSGAGTLELKAGTSVFDAQFISSAPLFLHGDQHRFVGTGLISVQSCENYGEISADVPDMQLRIDAVDLQNFSTLRATDGGQLLLAANIVQSDSARIEPLGSLVSLNQNTRVEGGILGDFSGMVLSLGTGPSGAPTLYDLTLNGPLGIPQGKSLRLEGAIQNEGLLEVNQDCGSSDAILIIAGEVELSGRGALRVLTAGSSFDGQVVGEDLDDPALGTIAPQLTNGPNHLVRGRGRISVELINEGRIAADEGHELILVEPLWNHGHAEAVHQSTLEIRSLGEEGLTGSWFVEAKSSVVFPSAISKLSGFIELESPLADLKIAAGGYPLAGLSEIADSGGLRLTGGRGELFSGELLVQGELQIEAGSNLYMEGGASASYRQTETGHLTLRLAEAEEQGMALMSEGGLTLAGELSIEGFDSHEFEVGDRWRVLGGRFISGDFAIITNNTGDDSIAFTTEVVVVEGFSFVEVVAVEQVTDPDNPDGDTGTDDNGAEEDTADSDPDGGTDGDPDGEQDGGSDEPGETDPDENTGDDSEEGPNDPLPTKVSLRASGRANEIRVFLELPYDAETRMEVFDIQGRCVTTSPRASSPAGERSFSVPGNYASGLYFVRATVQGEQQQMKVVTTRVMIVH